MIQSSNSEKFERMAEKLQENCQQFDVLNEQLDELIAKIEEDINKSPLTQYRLKHKKVISE
ncbi:MAG: hypothetical protein QNJ42_12970 [Crocosphaera sp.]|nr:hypothetical protein [Crocosphaera sp.]